MGKSSHFSGQPLYGQVIKLLDKSKILQISREKGGERYTKQYFYGESANAIKIQIWVTLIANLLLMIMQKGLKRDWSFSGLATMLRITLMYYVDFYSLFNNPEKEWEIMLSEASGAPLNRLSSNLGGLYSEIDSSNTANSVSEPCFLAYPSFIGQQYIFI